MSIITILPDEEVKKIAAGEVVERPASVVKEIIENSIDAGSTKISLYVEKAGKRLIRVVDNGCGMSDEDAQTCFKNHATSKVKSLDDLQGLATFGFRGEALASISSVSQVVLKTRQKESQVGTQVTCMDGVCESQQVSCAEGTDISLKNLFYNTPVRQKFLKQDETEWNQIQTLLHACCLSNLAIHFQLYRDNKMVLNAPQVEDLKTRALQLWGHNTVQNIVEVQGSTVTGVISKHHYWRYGRDKIFFFVNGRWVKDPQLSKALMKGYREVLPPTRFPLAVLSITIDPSRVDINVHPRKEEVRFIQPMVVQGDIQKAITGTLEQVVQEQLSETSLGKTSFSATPFGVAPSSGSPGGSVPLFSKKAFDGQVEAMLQGSSIEQDIVSHSVTDTSVTDTSVTDAHIDNADVAIHESEGQEQQVFVQGRAFTQEQVDFKIIGQLLNTYIVVENKDGLLLIDQHAAHERILYEQHLKHFEHKEGTRLLFPEIVSLHKNQIRMVLAEKDFLQQQGIEVEQIGTNDLAIKTSPPKIESKSLRELLFEMIEFIEQHEDLDQEIFRKKLNEHMHSQLACKMAVKAGDALSLEMMQNIVSQLRQVPNRFICVHGRPTTWQIGTLELEKKFRRK